MQQLAMNKEHNRYQYAVSCRKVETKNCLECGKEITGLARKVRCNKCVDKLRQRKKREKDKGNT
jgi:hypothetical protein